jgi:hypothetical protein
MKWTEFISEDPAVRKKLEQEFESMRRYAFKYFVTRTKDLEQAKDFAHSVIEIFISRLMTAGELNSNYFKIRVRGFFLDFYRYRQLHPDYSRQDAPYLSELEKELASDTCSGTGSDPQPNPEEAFEIQEIMQIRSEILDSFNEIHREIIRFKELGYSTRNIQILLEKDHLQVSADLINVIFHKYKIKIIEALVRCGWISFNRS